MLVLVALVWTAEVTTSLVVLDDGATADELSTADEYEVALGVLVVARLVDVESGADTTIVSVVEVYVAGLVCE